jgi:hypothetical protein
VGRDALSALRLSQAVEETLCLCFQCGWFRLGTVVQR